MPVLDLPELREKVAVFADRTEAGRRLAALLEDYRGSQALVLGIPAGGLAVASALAEELGLPMDVAVVSKITFPWNPESGYGAVAFDGTVRLNQALIADMGLLAPDVSIGRSRTAEKVRQRVSRLRGERPFPDLAGRTAIVVDDGVASSITMATALEAVRHYSPASLVVAVPTGYRAALDRLLGDADQICCLNVRSGWGFAVADAYRRWSDVSDGEAEAIVHRLVA
jgi:predicted phosphoribosyltransferase